MSFEGMDVDQLDSLAKQIGADATALYDLVNSLNGAVNGLIFAWNGPAAASFEQDWRNKNRPALMNAYTTLTNLHAHLVNNINQQSSASAAEGGWTAERVVGDAENTLTGLGLVGIPVAALADTSKFLGIADKGLTGLGYVGAAISAYHVEGDQIHFDQDLVDGHYVAAANEMADELSEGLKGASAFVPFPYSVAVYGAGVDVRLLDEVANLDWSDMPNPLSGDNWQTIYAPGFSSMKTAAYWEQAGNTLWGAM